MEYEPFRSNAFELPDTNEAIEYYYKQGLTDGLPIIPPTTDLVQQFLEASKVAPKEVLGIQTARQWKVTADKVAVNAIMAGCKPEYAPVVIASIKALLEPAFNAPAVIETAANNAPLIVVNGPILKELDINSGWNLFGPGHRANATIGRALRLVLLNVCNVKPGVTEKSNFGHSGRYTFCIGENEESSPWEPYHVENGFSLDTSTVSLFAVNHPFEAINYADNQPEGILETISHMIAAYIRCHGYVVIILGPEHAQNISAAGWDKKKVKTHVSERVNALRPTVAFDEERIGALVGASFQEASNPHNSKVETTPDRITVMVAGGEGGGHSTILPRWSMGLTSKSIIKPIDQR